MRFAMRLPHRQRHPRLGGDRRAGARGARARRRLRGSGARAGRVDAAARRAVARHRDRSVRAAAARGRAPRLRRLRGAAADARRARAARQGARPFASEARAARGPRARACASSTRTCSPAGTSSTSTWPCSTAHRGARARAARARPRPGRRCACAGRRARRRAPGERARARGARRHPAPARRLRAHGRLRRSTRSRARCWARARRSRATAAPTRSCGCSRRTATRLVEYNRTDARLALEILERLRLVELAVERSRLTGMPLDRVASLDRRLRLPLPVASSAPRGIVAPSVRLASDAPEPQAGGHVLEPLPGLYRNVVVLDFKSLYPSLIRTFEIDPWNLLRPEAGPGGGRPDRRAQRRGVRAPQGHPGRAPRRADAARARRRAAPATSVKSHAIKILMNSFYGVLGTPACRFYDPRLANAITGFGREMLLWCRARIEAGGRRVLYGDTDSLFVETRAEDAAAARDAGARARREPQRASWRAHRRALARRRAASSWCSTASTCGCACPPCATATAGARKRYAGLVDTADGPRVVFTGMEAVRGDWTELAQAGPARAVRAALRATGRSIDYLRGRGRRAARRPARRAARLPQGAAQGARGLHRDDSARTWRRRARSPARRAGASPT